MNASLRYFGLFAAALLAVATIAPANASPQFACNGLPISEVRAIIGGSPVFKPGSMKRQGGLIISDCGYTSAVRGGNGVLIMLMKSPTNSSLATYAAGLRSAPNHGGGAVDQKNDILVSVRVAGENGIDFVKSKNLLAALLQKM